MFIRAQKQMIGAAVHAADGDVGGIKGFYFDAQDWAVRYVVVETGGWLDSREVVLSPASFLNADWKEGKISVYLTREQIGNAPHVDLTQPISRGAEESIAAYYTLPRYWNESAGVRSEGPGPAATAGERKSSRGEVVISEDRIIEEERVFGENLVNSADLLDYTIHARDGEVGEIEDLIIDDSIWSLRYLLTDAGSWLSGRKVLVSPGMLTEVDEAQNDVVADLTKEQLRNSPEFDPDQGVTPDYEQKLSDYYERVSKQ